MKLLINIYGAPKSGKTTMMCHLTTYLKMQNIKCEMASDYPKEILYEERFSLLKRQLYILAKQEKKIYDLYKFSDVVVTDCPILHNIVYNHEEYVTLHPYIKELYEQYNNLNIVMLRRQKVNYGCFKLFKPEELKQIEEDILKLFENIEFYPLVQEASSLEKGVKIVAEILKKEER